VVGGRPIEVSVQEEQHYFARVTAGLEQLAWQDIERHAPARLLGYGHRRIDFVCAGPPAALLELRSVDDVYIFVARLGGLDHTRASLARLTQRIAQVDFAPAAAVCAAVRALGPRPSYRVTASHLGRRNYSRYDVEGAVEAGLADLLPWRYVPNDPEEPEPDLDLRVLLEDDWALIGLRLGATPLHRRAYKVASRPGSLKAPVAYCLCLLAGLERGDTLLDPACGAGTILVEAAALMRAGVIVGGDIDTAALETARANVEAVGLTVSMAHDAARDLSNLASHAASAASPTILLYHGDASDLPLPDGAIRTVASNLPWGQQVPVGVDLAGLYQAILRSIARVLATGGRAALLTDQAESLLAALDACPTLRLESTLQISLFGRHPTIYVLAKG
jgi:23S rRNA G2445 N2-methylase RlmL